MKRRKLLTTGALAALGSSLSSKNWVSVLADQIVQYPELNKHKIEKYELIEVDFRWPRFVGKNGRIDFHGQDKKATVLKLLTDQGALGWGLSNRNAEKHFPLIKDKPVAECITPGTGIRGDLDPSVDFALHDLMGVILNEPVYKLLGNKGTRETPVYSGMIYLDELNPGNESKGLDAILENCEWDYHYGYRQLKVKIGRSGRWYPHKEGLDKDIEVVKKIYGALKGRNTELLVDANDMYSLEDTINFLKGLGDVPLFWVEEPFVEEINTGRSLRRWMDNNGFANTYYADGERNPEFDVCLQMGKEKVMDVFLPDIFGYGFTNWIKLMPELKKMGMLSSPHAWGDRLKTNYSVHLAAGLGNVTTIEGVTCLSEDIDYGNYPFIDGKIKVSDDPGFGMKLMK